MSLSRRDIRDGIVLTAFAIGFVFMVKDMMHKILSGG